MTIEEAIINIAIKSIKRKSLEKLKLRLQEMERMGCSLVDIKSLIDDVDKLINEVEE